jgi:hypothetical protein
VSQAILQFLTDFWVMVGALAAVFSAIVFAVAAVVGWFQLREAQKLRKAQTRPFVVIEFRVESSSIIYLRVSNIGSTMARDIQFSIDPPLQTTRGERWNVMELGIFKSGIKTLPPGRVIEFLFDTWIGRDEMNDRYVAKLSYSGDDGTKYPDEMDLDLGVYRNMHFIHRQDLNDIAKHLEKIAGTLDDFKAWGGGLLALSPEDVAKRDEEWNKAIAESRTPEKTTADARPKGKKKAQTS